MQKIALAALLTCSSACLADAVTTYSHSGNVLAVSVAGARANSCAPDSRRLWRASSAAGVIRLYYWDNFLGDACFSVGREFSVDLSIEDICLDGTSCAGSSVELYAVAAGCVPQGQTEPTCLASQSRPVRFDGGAGGSFRGIRTATGPWEYHGEDIVGPLVARLFLSEIDGAHARLILDTADSSQTIDGSFQGGVFAGDRTDGAPVFAFLKSANSLVSNSTGPAFTYSHYDADGRIVTAPEPGIPPNDVKTNPLIIGGTYVITDLTVPARIMEIRGTENDSGFAQLKVDGRYGGGVSCSVPNCIFEFATAQGLVRKVVPAQALGYEAIYYSLLTPQVFAVRLAP